MREQDRAVHVAQGEQPRTAQEADIRRGHGVTAHGDFQGRGMTPQIAAVRGQQIDRGLPRRVEVSVRQFLYVLYVLVVIVMFSCTSMTGSGGGGGYGGTSARSGYSSYGSHK